MNILLKEKGILVNTYPNQVIIPNADDRIVLNLTTIFRVERRYIDFIKQEVILEGFKYALI